MKTTRWILPLAAAAFLAPAWACQGKGSDDGTTVIHEKTVVHDQQPDTSGNGMNADIHVDDQGNVSGGVEVKKKNP